MDNVNPDLKLDLLHALKNNQFILHFQPQYNVYSSKFEGVEALIRWLHPTKGLLLPGNFLPFIENSGFMVRIGDWVVKAACEQIKNWQEKGLPPVRIAINVSEIQFKSKNFVEMVMDTLNTNRIKPKYLELEITEKAILHNDRVIIESIHRLRKLGVIIALDDFGTGYSSISHLKKIPVDRIKIDKSFIQHISHSSDDAAIVKAIIALSNSLNIQVLAEGVETLKQMQMLIFQECKEIQGFYISKPLTAVELETFLVKYKNQQFLK